MNCPACGYGDYNGGKCPSCGTDSTSLFRMNELPDVYYNKAVELLKQERLEEAREALTITIGLRPHDVDALVLLGKVCAEAGDYERAALYWNKATSLDEEKAQGIKADIARMETLKAAFVEKPSEEKAGLEKRIREIIREEIAKGLSRWAAYAGAILVIVVIAGFFLSPLTFLNPIRGQKPIKEERKERITAEVEKSLLSHGFSNILAEEKSGFTYLTGKVPTFWDKYKIERAMEQVKELGGIDTRGIEVMYPRGYHYRVKKGESLWSIAEKLLSDGKRFNEIQEANKEFLRNVRIISAGDILLIPE